jgi:hypothetical protein
MTLVSNFNNTDDKIVQHISTFASEGILQCQVNFKGNTSLYKGICLGVGEVKFIKKINAEGGGPNQGNVPHSD